MDMLCYMWESEERGVMVKPNGEIYSKREIEVMLGKDASGSYTWLDRLIDGGVCGVRLPDGAIYSRRMVRDASLSEKRRLAGSKGGKATISKVVEQKAPVATEKPKIQEPTLFPTDTADAASPPAAPPPLTEEQKKKAAKAVKYKYAEYVTLTRDEYAKLCEQYSEQAAKRMIEILDNYKGQNGKRYRSDYRAILNWVVNRYNEELIRYGSERKTANQGGNDATGSATAQGIFPAQRGNDASTDPYSQKDYSERL